MVLRNWAVAAALAMAAFGCGEVKVDDTPAAPADTATADVIAPDAQQADVPPTDTASTVPDAAAETESECVTDFDCALSSSVKGKNPCSPPACDNGKCVIKKKKAGTPCVDKTLAPSECQTMACDDGGICALANKKDGAVCGLGSCGHKCDVGLCIAASATDYNDNNPCTKDYCNQGIEIVHEKTTDLTAICDDGNACTGNDACLKGECKGLPIACSDGVDCTKDSCDPKTGCVAESKDSFCDDGNPCTNDVCDKGAGCKVSGFAAKAACDDGNACTKNDACNDKGECGGEATCKCQTDADCKQDNLCLGPPSCVNAVCVSDPAKAVQCDPNTGSSCLLNLCDSKTGKCALDAVDDGKACDDANACSSVSTCEAGKCAGLFDVTCDDKNTCTDDACSPQAGCVFAPNAASCDDGNACTSGDACGNGACSGAAKSCDDNLDCTLDSCDAKTGTCANAANNAKCDDNNVCTADTCDAKAGCQFKPNDAASCDDGDACTSDKCSGGKCAGTPICQCKDDAGCNDNNPCTADKCTAGKCSNDAAGMDSKACDVGDKCQVANSGLCAAGVCKSGNKPIACTAPSVCQTAACNPATGKCETSNKPDGVTCDADGNGCTQGDKCAAGTCAAGNPANCAAQNTPCATGTCTSTGANAFACTATPKAKGAACDDGSYCTTGDNCDGAGKCTAGTPLSCAAQNDACNTGTCDEAKDQCAKTPKANTVGCDDALFCTSGDHCDGSGKCGGTATVCPNGNCTVGVCDEVGKKCGTKAAAAGTACSDNSVCTAGDVCDATGLCKGGAATACNDNNPCTADSCDATKGCVYTPSASATCDDGNACTTGDKCDATGKCQAGTFTCQCSADSGCNDGNACTTDKCVSGKCQNAITANAACDDKDPCSLASLCDATGACVPDKTKMVDCSASADTCNTAACTNSNGTAACVKLPKTVTTSCDDGLFCTTGDLCNNGKCVGGPPPTCGKPAVCNTTLCSEAAKGCTSQPSTKGTSCSDGNACTSGDNCDGAGKCLAGTALPNFAACDDGNAATSGDFCWSSGCAGFDTFAGSPGPTASIDWSDTPNGFRSLSLNEAKLDVAQTGNWGINAYAAGTPSWTFKVEQSLGTLNPPMMAMASQVAVGAGGAVWFYPSGGTAWQPAGNLLSSALKGACTTGPVDWISADSMVISGKLYAGLSGYCGASNVNVVANCSGDPAGKVAPICAFSTFPSVQRTVESVLRTHLACLTCAPTVYHNVQSFALNTSTGLFIGMYNHEAPFGNAYATFIGTAIQPNNNLLAGGLWRLNTSALAAPPAGATLRWLVGPSGVVAYEKSGTTGANMAAVTKNVQSGYAFSSVFKVGTFVLVFGSRPDPANAANRVPVLFAHDDSPNTQTGITNWTELAINGPVYDTLLCPNNGVQGLRMAAGPADLLGFINSCSNIKPSTAIVTRKTNMLHRALPPPIP